MSTADSIRVFSVDDHPLLREGIATLIKSQPDMVLVSEASTGREAIQQFQKHQPDITLMDLRLPDMNGKDVMIAIRTEFPDARIIMLTTFEGDVEIQRALEAGAHGYMLKSFPPKELLEVIRQVHAGKKRIPPEIAAHIVEHISDEALTEREVEVVGEIAGGNRNRDIAEKLLITAETGQSAHQTHHGKTWGQRPNSGVRHRRSPWHYSALTTLLKAVRRYHDSSTKQFQSLGIRPATKLFSV